MFGKIAILDFFFLFVLFVHGPIISLGRLGKTTLFTENQREIRIISRGFEQFFG